MCVLGGGGVNRRGGRPSLCECVKTPLWTCRIRLARSPVPGQCCRHAAAARLPPTPRTDGCQLAPTHPPHPPTRDLQRQAVVAVPSLEGLHVAGLGGWEGVVAADALGGHAAQHRARVGTLQGRGGRMVSGRGAAAHTVSSPPPAASHEHATRQLAACAASMPKCPSTPPPPNRQPPTACTWPLLAAKIVPTPSSVKERPAWPSSQSWSVMGASGRLGQPSTPSTTCTGTATGRFEAGRGREGHLETASPARCVPRHSLPGTAPPCSALHTHTHTEHHSPPRPAAGPGRRRTGAAPQSRVCRRSGPAPSDAPRRPPRCTRRPRDPPLRPASAARPAREGPGGASIARMSWHQLAHGCFWAQAQP